MKKNSCGASSASLNEAIRIWSETSRGDTSNMKTSSDVSIFTLNIVKPHFHCFKTSKTKRKMAPCSFSSATQENPTIIVDSFSSVDRSISRRSSNCCFTISFNWSFGAKTVSMQPLFTLMWHLWASVDWHWSTFKIVLLLLLLFVSPTASSRV